MTHPLWDIVHLKVPCPSCRKDSFETVGELIHNISLTCDSCGSKIDISSESWRTSIEAIAESLSNIYRFPPVGD